jgi:hypothetical protein
MPLPYPSQTSEFCQNSEVLVYNEEEFRVFQELGDLGLLLKQ